MPAGQLEQEPNAHLYGEDQSQCFFRNQEAQNSLFLAPPGIGEGRGLGHVHALEHGTQHGQPFLHCFLIRLLLYAARLVSDDGSEDDVGVFQEAGARQRLPHREVSPNLWIGVQEELGIWVPERLVELVESQVVPRNAIHSCQLCGARVALRIPSTDPKAKPLCPGGWAAARWSITAPQEIRRVGRADSQNPIPTIQQPVRAYPSAASNLEG